VLMQQLVNGIALGAVYALITIGYSMVYSVLRLMNVFVNRKGDHLLIEKGAILGTPLEP
jgi:hypothetical protein